MHLLLIAMPLLLAAIVFILIWVYKHVAFLVLEKCRAGTPRHARGPRRSARTAAGQCHLLHQQGEAAVAPSSVLAPSSKARSP